MALTWRDGVSAIVMIAIVAAYALYIGGYTVWLLASTWATTAVILLFSMIGAWAIWAAGELRASSHLLTAICRAAEVIIGVICLFAGLGALLLDSRFALQLVVVTAVSMCGLATLRHALTVPPDQ